MNIQLKLAYNGTLLWGWQKSSHGPSVEALLSSALEQILQHPVTLQAASRTDRGVHAEGQIVNFFTDRTLNLSTLHFSLNSLLPYSIRVLHVEEKPLTFHPTSDVVGKEYLYFVCYARWQLPKHSAFSWHFPYPLDIPKMKEAATLLEGTHDFSAFCNNHPEKEGQEKTCHLFCIKLLPLAGKRLQISVVGDRFLYKMTRNIVGTLCYVGRGDIAPTDISHILRGKNRPQAGITAPALGLTLNRVFYNSLEEYTD
ncbi:MAG: tRNA pseudouridine(38-40) synthase TruA [Chlamydiales bacterium]